MGDSTTHHPHPPIHPPPGRPPVDLPGSGPATCADLPPPLSLALCLFASSRRPLALSSTRRANRHRATRGHTRHATIQGTPFDASRHGAHTPGICHHLRCLHGTRASRLRRETLPATRTGRSARLGSTSLECIVSRLMYHLCKSGGVRDANGWRTMRKSRSANKQKEEKKRKKKTQ